MQPEVEQFAEQLRHRLKTGPSPRSARAKSASRFEPELCYGRHRGPATVGARPAAVIALLYRHREVWHLPLTLRPTHLNDHAGQVSLPGGSVESCESYEECALRELHEELGVPPSEVRVIGRLSTSFVYASGFCVRPFVGIAEQRPGFQPNPDEVAQLLELPLSHLFDPENYGTHVIRRRGLQFRTPHILFEGHPIWGATGIILGELLGVLREIV